MESELASWFAAQLPEAEVVRIDGLDRVNAGHSAETVLLKLRWRSHGAEEAADLVLRFRPPPPGLLEPYDLKRQFDVLRRLEGTPVRAPRALWHEPTGEVLGREFYVMERLAGTVYEQASPDKLNMAPERVRRMSESLIEQIAAIHTVDLHATGLDAIGDGRNYLDRELEHWAGEMQRVQRGPLPALERLLAVLLETKPEPCPMVTLVHGDAKPGNFAFVGDEVAAVYDWEMATVGDPLADIGWAELMWNMPGEFTTLPGAFSVDEFVARYEELTGIAVEHRGWYRAFQCFKMTVIMLVGAMLFNSGQSDDLRLVDMGIGVPFITQHGLAELGIRERLDHGPVAPREERVEAVRAKLARMSESNPAS